MKNVHSTQLFFFYFIIFVIIIISQLLCVPSWKSAFNGVSLDQKFSEIVAREQMAASSNI